MPPSFADGEETPAVEQSVAPVEESPEAVEESPEAPVETPAPSAEAESTGPIDGPQTRSAMRAPSVATVPNPELPAQCGLKIALVFDLSNSLSASDVRQSKAAGKQFVDTLAGTPSSVGVYSFATFAPATGNSNLAATSIASAGGANAVKAKIDGLQVPPNNRGGTNWDAGLRQISAGYDLVIFVTDGNPTAYGTPGAPGNPDYGTDFDQIDLDTAVRAANALKGAGTFVMGLAVGSDINYTNIAAVSGPRAGTDYYAIGNYEQLAAALKAIALKTCGGTVNIVKQIVDEAGTVIAVGDGWTFDAAGEGLSPASATTNADGAVSFKLAAMQPGESRDVTISERLQDNFQLFPQGGKNAVCTVGGAPVAVTNVGENGFVVPVGFEQVVSCVVHNLEQKYYEPLAVTKTAEGRYDAVYDWEIAKGVDRSLVGIAEGGTHEASYEVIVTEGARTTSNYVVAGNVTVSNPNDEPVVATLSDTLAGATCTFPDVADVDPASDGLQVSVPAGSASYAYACSFAQEPAETVTNTASVAWSKEDYPQRAADASYTASASAETGFVEASSKHKAVTVSDTFAEFGDAVELTWSEQGKVHTFGYTRTFEGTPGECETYTNTASLVSADGLEKSADASVKLCVGSDLAITKTAAVAYDRAFDWDLTKSVDRADFLLGDGELATPNYTLTVRPSAPIDTASTVTGEITIKNPNAWAVPVAGLTDVVTGLSQDGLACELVAPEQVAAGATITVPYVCEGDFTAVTGGVNTAQLTWGHGSVDGLQIPTPHTSATARADVAVGEPGTIANQKVTVYDDFNDQGRVEVGWVSVDNAGVITSATTIEGVDVKVVDNAAVFTYGVSLTPTPGECVTYPNTASVLDKSAAARVDVFAPAIEKNAYGNVDRAFTWHLDKLVDPDSQVVSAGEQANVEYWVHAWASDPVDTPQFVGGAITVTVPEGVTLPSATLRDELPAAQSCTIMTQGGVEVSFPMDITETTTFLYRCDVETTDVGTNTATLSWGDSHVSASAEVSEWLLRNVVNPDLTVTDDKTDPDHPVELGVVTIDKDGVVQAGEGYEVIDGKAVFAYELQLSGESGQCTSYTNRVWGVAEGRITDEAVTEVCELAPLAVAKTAAGTFERTFDWSIDKQASTPGKDGRVDYTVSARATGHRDSAFVASGEITVTNPTNFAAGTYSITDVLDVPVGEATCEVRTSAGEAVDVPLTLEAGASLTLSYECAFADGDSTTNTASVHYTDAVGTTGVIDASAELDFELGRLVGDKATIVDDKTVAGAEHTLGVVTVDAEGKVQPGEGYEVVDGAAVFTYSLTLKPKSGECINVTNTAWIAETGDKDSAQVKVCKDAPIKLPITGSESSALILAMLTLGGLGAAMIRRRYVS